MPEIEVETGEPDGALVIDLLCRAEFAGSRSEAKRLLAQGGFGWTGSGSGGRRSGWLRGSTYCRPESAGSPESESRRAFDSLGALQVAAIPSP